MKLYKLTDQDGYTRKGEEGETKWSEGFTLKLETKDNPKLCSSDVIHAYKNMNLALLLNPIHANIENPKIWEAEGKIVVEDWGKVGCSKLTTKQVIYAPDWHKDKNKAARVQVMFAYLCAKTVLPVFENIYPNDNRPRKAIEAVKEYLKNPTSANAYAAYAAATANAANAAYAAATANAANAAYAAATAYTAYTANAYAAYAAATATANAAYTANAYAAATANAAYTANAYAAYAAATANAAYTANAYAAYAAATANAANAAYAAATANAAAAAYATTIDLCALADEAVKECEK